MTGFGVGESNSRSLRDDNKIERQGQQARATATATATAKATTNTGVLRFAQNDKQKSVVRNDKLKVPSSMASYKVSLE
jgi:hypothetical protein